MKKVLNFIENLFSSHEDELVPEAFTAYLHRLPEGIEVAWKKDGNFIIGWIKEDNQKNIYMTQAKNGEEFIDMVNDAVYTYHSIPNPYRDLIKKFRAYNPAHTEMVKLYDGKITEATLGLRKQMVSA